MRRLFIVAAVLIGIVALVAAATPLLLSTEVVRDRIADQIARLTGRSVTFAGEPEVSLYPYLSVKLRDVKVANPAGMDGDFVTMEELSGKVEILPLLAGRTEIAEFRLVKPRITLAVAADGRINWGMKQGAVGTQAAKRDAEVPSEETAPRSPPADIRLGRFILEDGTITYDSARSGRHESFTGVNIDFAWPSTAQPSSGTGGFTWRGEPVEFNGLISTPQEIISGGATPVRFSFASAPLRINFTGTALRLQNMQVEGDTTIAAPSVRRVFEWAGMPMGTGAILGAGSLTGRLSWAGSTAALADARIELDGNKAEGALTLTASDGRPDVKGTLAFASLDLTAYAEALASWLRGPRAYAAASFALPALDAALVDLRLSAERLLVGDVALGQAAAAVMLRDGRLTATIGDAALFDGRGGGKLTLESRDGGIAAGLTLSLTGISAGKALAALRGPGAIDGTLTASADLTAAGATDVDLATSLAGSARVSLANGNLKGVDLRLVPAAIAAAPTGATVAGSTPFTTAEGTFRIDDGTIATEDFTLKGADYEATLSAQMSVFAGGLEAQGSITPAAPPAQPVPFTVDGTPQAPAFHPALGGVIRRDGTEPAETPTRPSNG